MSRLSKADRRSQLLDVSADLVLTSGAGAVTMERLAERAGVSKALVYLHFDNSGAVLAELYRREVTRLGIEILTAVGGLETPEDKLRVAVHTYLDVVRDRGALFTTLAAAVPAVPIVAGESQDDSRLAHDFVADLFERIFDLPERRSQVAAALFLGALNGGIDAWAIGELRRCEIEEAAIALALHLANDERDS